MPKTKLRRKSFYLSIRLWIICCKWTVKIISENQSSNSLKRHFRRIRANQGCFSRKNTKNQIWHIVQDKQGNTVWLELTMFHSGQNGHLLISFVSDETQNKLQETDCSRLKNFEAIGHMAGGISHDFNNILAIIEGYARIAKNNMEKKARISLHILIKSIRPHKEEAG